MEKELLKLAFGFVAVGLVMSVLERLLPTSKTQSLLRKGFATDLIYWFVPAILYVPFAPGTLVGASLTVKEWLGAGGQTSLGFSAISNQSIWLQAVEVLVLMDLLSYLGHRLLHGRLLWRFHAIHHSVEEMDWLSAARNHPVNVAVQRLVSLLPLLLLGFSPLAIAMVGPIFAVWNIVVHANLDIAFGPLEKLVVSPLFHRWHHTHLDEGGQSNFGDVFSLWDVLFGTFKRPGNKAAPLGIDEPLPNDIMGQMIWPFHHPPSPDTDASGSEALTPQPK